MGGLTSNKTEKDSTDSSNKTETTDFSIKVFFMVVAGVG